MKFTDTAAMSGTRTTADGFMVSEAFAVRTGIQLYAGSEVGLVDRDIVRVYRPEDKVRRPESLATFSHAPITLGHPAEPITKDNWANLAKGEVSTEATWDGNKIKLPLIFKDKDAIAAIEGGTRELSAGYTCDLDLTAGVTEDGSEYDAIQRNIKINHLAIVPRGRAGSKCRIGDDASKWGATPRPPESNKAKDTVMEMLTVVLGDQATQVAAADAPKIEKWKADQAKLLADAGTASVAAIASKDEEIGKLKAANAKLTADAMTPEKLSKIVADRVALEASVMAIDADIETKNVSDADLRKAAVVAVHGDEMVADASDAEINGMFKALAKTAATKDTFAEVLKDGKSKTVETNDAWATFLPKEA